MRQILDVKNWLIRKDSNAGKDWKQEGKGMIEDEMVGWHHHHDEPEFEQAPGVSDGQGSLVWCNSWGHKELDTTEWLNWAMISKIFQFSSVTQSCPTLCDPMDCSTPGLPVHYQPPELTRTHVHRVSDAIQPFHPLSSPLLLPSIFPSIRIFSNESVLHIRWPKYWNFSFSTSPSNEHSGLISFRMDWLEIHAVQGTLKSLLQHHISEAPILQCSAFFITQLSYPYMTTGKTITLTRWTSVEK